MGRRRDPPGIARGRPPLTAAPVPAVRPRDSPRGRGPAPGVVRPRGHRSRRGRGARARGRGRRERPSRRCGVRAGRAARAVGAWGPATGDSPGPWVARKSPSGRAGPGTPERGPKAAAGGRWKPPPRAGRAPLTPSQPGRRGTARPPSLAAPAGGPGDPSPVSLEKMRVRPRRRSSRFYLPRPREDGERLPYFSVRLCLPRARCSPGTVPPP